MQFVAWSVLLAVASCPAMAGTAARLVPVSYRNVTFDSGFWASRLEINRTRTLPHNLATCESTGRLRNIAQAAGVDRTPFHGHIFHDSDVFKVLEAAAYVLALFPDPALEARLDEIIGWLARAQQPDGYLNTFFIMAEPKRRWTDLRGAHELYCAGHMFEAAVAHFEATGKRTFLDVARKYADHIDRTFGPEKLHAVDGHPESELALFKLWRATGDERYLKLSRFLIEEHGQAKTHQLFGTYCQDHKPIRDQDEAVGHCVRAMYFYSGVADHAMLTGDEGYAAALGKLWRDVVDRKMYVTGSIGVQGHGEGFSKPYDLPNADAYCETCAAIGMAYWNHRMTQLKGEARFADVLERALYNGILSGVSLDGVKFFYVNPLASRGNAHRQPWHGCACCPTNMVRFVASVGQYFYAASAEGDAAYVLHYASGKGVVPLKDGKVQLVQRTNYPWDGAIQVIVEPQGASEFAVCLRVPGWCEGAKVRLNGKELPEAAPKDGFIAVRRKWASGETLDLDLPMPIRRVEAHPEVKENAGRLAIQRGPIVYCLEKADNPFPVSQVAIPRDAKLEAKLNPDLLGGVVVIKGQGTRVGFAAKDDGSIVPTSQPVEITAIPYYAWDNREPGDMVVWVPTELPTAKPENVTIAMLAKPSASHVWKADHLNALNDGVLPKASNDHNIPRFTWWDHTGTTEWVAYEFERPLPFSKAEVYWFDDTGSGSCRVPKSWRLLWRDGGTWKPVEGASLCGVEKDRLNVVTFQPVTTQALRIEAQLQPGFSAGILEWRLPK